MTTTTPSAALVPAMPVLTNTERLALAGFLAGYSGLTREAYALDLRQFASWCHQHHLRLFGARRADIECFARDLEARGRARATVARRLCTIAGFYRYAAGEELLDHSPATHVRRPRLDRHGAGRTVRRIARRAGITQPVGPHTLRHAFITAALDAGVPLRDVQEAASHADPRTTMRYDGAPAAWTGTPPTSSPPTSRTPPGSSRAVPPGGCPARRDGH